MPPRTLNADVGVWFSCLTHTSHPMRLARSGQAYWGVGSTLRCTSRAAASNSSRVKSWSDAPIKNLRGRGKEFKFARLCGAKGEGPKRQPAGRRKRRAASSALVILPRVNPSVDATLPAQGFYAGLQYLDAPRASDKPVHPADPPVAAY